MKLKINKEELLSGISRADSIPNGSFCFKNAVEELPSWSDFVNHVHNAAHSEPVDGVSYMTFKEKPINNLILRNDFYMNCYLSDRNEFEGFEDMLGELTSMLGTGIGPVGSFVNFVGHDLVEPHYDNRRTLFIQCQGVTNWAILEPEAKMIGTNGEGLVDNYFLNPGDMLYIAHEVSHSVTINEPRAGIALGFY